MPLVISTKLLHIKPS